jgi:hypothetical protein
MWHRTFVVPVVSFLGVLALTFSANGQCDPEWQPAFGGAPGHSGVADSAVIFDDGNGGGPALHIAGSFAAAGGTLVNNIAKWDGEDWVALGSGLDAVAHASLPFDDGTTGGRMALYVSGQFRTADGVVVNRIARWDGETWSALGTGIHGEAVYALASFDDGSGDGPALFAGGRILSAGGVAARGVAKWDGTSWSPLGEGVDGGMNQVLAMQAFDDGSGPALYVGGDFTTAGGISAQGIARWDGETWSPVGDGYAGTVLTLVVFDDGRGPALYMGGTSGVFRWSGSLWEPLGGEAPRMVWGLLPIDANRPGGPALYVSGNFETAGGVAANNIAKWDGEIWSALNDGLSRGATLVDFDDDNDGRPEIYAACDFKYADGMIADGVARWDPDDSEWSTFGDGFGSNRSELNAVIRFDDGSGAGPSLFAAGEFDTVGGIVVSNIARWDGESWSALDGGLESCVNALAIYDDGSGEGEALYAGGEFGIAKWDGESWMEVEMGNWTSSEVVYALVVFDDGRGGGPVLCAGGNFCLPLDGGGEACDIATWDGQSWSALGNGLGGVYPTKVFALVAYDGEFGPTKHIGTRGGPGLYVGGHFSTAGDVEANGVARWDGTEWSALGSGIVDYVFALAVFDAGMGDGPELYAGGMFDEANGAPGNRIAVWNGNRWTGLGTGMDGVVYALATVESNDGPGPALYAGGKFSLADGTPASRVAQWDGDTWTDLDGGVSGQVLALTPLEDGSSNHTSLYVTGEVVASPAGDSYLAIWGCSPSPCPGDVDGDGDTDQTDLGLLLASYELPPDDPFFDPRADLNGDGEVGDPDLDILLADYECVP